LQDLETPEPQTIKQGMRLPGTAEKAEKEGDSDFDDDELVREFAALDAARERDPESDDMFEMETAEK
jgi:hypothetical protein